MKTIPDENQIENLFTHLRLSPSDRFYHHMKWAAWTPAGIARRRASVVSALTLALVAVMLAFTPQGRAWAQDLLRFFSRASSDSVLVTPLPSSPAQDSGYVFNKEIADVEERAGFRLLVPNYLPADYFGQPILLFAGASIEAEQNIVRIFYRYALGGEGITDGLVLREQRFQTVEACELCGMVGSSAVVETIPIGNVSGEYVEGVWKADDNGVWQWVPDPYVKTLRWQKGDLALELQYFGIEVGKADLIAIAESMK
jgi:hypothetical protein